MKESEFAKTVMIQAQLEMASTRRLQAEQKLRKIEYALKDIVHNESLSHAEILEKIKNLLH